MGFMDLMMDRWMKGQSPEQKRDMMSKMMPKMMESMSMETMHEMMPEMMNHCLTPMSKEERRKMFTFCRTMLGEMEEKFLASAEK